MSLPTSRLPSQRMPTTKKVRKVRLSQDERHSALTISGASTATTGALTKAGSGTLVLTEQNTYSGETTISGGTLQLGNGGTAGSIVGNVVNNGQLAFSRNIGYAFTGNISGTGSVRQSTMFMRME